MKRLRPISLIGVLVLTLLTIAGCDNGGATNNATVGQNTSQAQSTATTAMQPTATTAQAAASPTMAMDMGNPAPTPPPSTTPTISILAPADGATVNGDSLVITTHKTNFLYTAPATNLGDKAGQGNYRVFVDGKLATEDFGDVTAIPTDLLPEISAGQHTIDVQLFNDNGSAYQGAQNATIHVTLANAMSYKAAAGSPSLQIVGQPMPDGYGHFVIQAKIGGYFLDGTQVNNKPVQGLGHYHVYLDGGNLANVGVGTVSSIPSDINPNVVTPGQHSLHIVLETSQHVPIQGGESQTITFTVRPQDLVQNTPTAQSMYFPQTGYWLSGQFLKYWQANGGLARQGYPISAPVPEKSALDSKPYMVQYFERAEFELHPENQAPNDVLLSQLGSFRYKAKYANGAPNQVASTNNAYLFSQTGKTIGGNFRAYWEANGGLAQFGYPISNPFQEKSDLDGKTYTVQYFERAEFEYHPENQPPYNVLLSQLGTFQHSAQR